MELCHGKVQFWTRAGPTAVGMDAYRVAVASKGDYWGFVQWISAKQATPVFEFVGRQSRKKAFEGNLPRLVLLAVRMHDTGGYWEQDRMQQVGERDRKSVV